jgi:hypothetical protein
VPLIFLIGCVDSEIDINGKSSGLSLLLTLPLPLPLPLPNASFYLHRACTPATTLHQRISLFAPQRTSLSTATSMHLS